MPRSRSASSCSRSRAVCCRSRGGGRSSPTVTSQRASGRSSTRFETCLPTRPFCAEWQALQRRNYRSFTTNETVIPDAFVALYGVAVVAGVLLLAGVG